MSTAPQDRRGRPPHGSRPEDTDHGRVATFHDPFGHRWLLTRPA
ncbi:hypothetical protein [Lapillicoccus sp.]|nr:hypothetical protein [Lapillicoccus sp.]